MDALIESETQLIESDGWPLRGQYSQGQVSESKELYMEEQSVVEMDYDGAEDLDFDEGDEKMLLHRQLTFSNLGGSIAD